MTGKWLRRSVLATVCASAALLAACGSSSVESAITPQRFIAFGDGLSDLGQTGPRYTVNDGSVSVWTQQLATSYGKTLVTAGAGGTSYAVGNARVAAKPDAAGSNATATITEQVATFLASGKPQASDVLVINGGTSDVVANFAAVQAGRLTEAQALANTQQAGKDLAKLVRQLVDAGGNYVLANGTYDLGRSPLAFTTGKADLLSRLSSSVNTALLLDISDLGAKVLYVDMAFYYNLVTGSPGSYGLTDSTTVVCTSVDPGPGIGTGAGQVSAVRCNPGTIRAGLDYNKYIFADAIHFTPVAQRLFGVYAYDRLRTRF